MCMQSLQRHIKMIYCQVHYTIKLLFLGRKKREISTEVQSKYKK